MGDRANLGDPGACCGRVGWIVNEWDLSSGYVEEPGVRNSTPITRITLQVLTKNGVSGSFNHAINRLELAS